ncbi:hypothetical protein KRX57_05870 [Weeksellaceae bacterium TAE3-ERU29]|nr:hypothetical protein [Weeksellaceae bacterium TAE3-ERU29]
MEFIKMLMYLLPMLFLSGIFFLLLDRFFKEEHLRRQQEITPDYTKENKNDILTTQKLQAYERMALFLERIRPTSLVRRLELNDSIDTYEYSLISSIQEEFNHNLSQQIYIAPDTWNIIFSTKNATQNFIKQCRESLDENANAEQLRDMIIKKSVDGNEPSSSALLKLQKDVQSF